MNLPPVASPLNQAEIDSFLLWDVTRLGDLRKADLFPKLTEHGQDSRGIRLCRET